ncbi:MAG: acyltransferase [Chitinophagaceae bacterium]
MTNSILHNRSAGLDLARSLAISMVIFSHFAVHSLESFGFWGVELFFALSGFLIGQILWKTYESAPKWSFPYIFNFWSRRWWRTLPNYYLFLIVLLIGSIFSAEGMPAFKEVSKFFWFGQDFTKGYYGFFPVSWSLCIEEWFYLLFPLVLFLLSLLPISKKTGFLFTLLIFFAGCFFLRIALTRQGNAGILRIITLGRLDAIACGVLIAFWNTIKKPSIQWKRIAFAIGLVIWMILLGGILLHFITYEKLIERPDALFLVPFGFALMLPFISLLKIEKPKFRLFALAVEKISLWSYSIYLSHLPVMWAVYSLTESIRSSTIGNLVSKILGLVITIIISALLFKYFEEPLTKKRPATLKLKREKMKADLINHNENT